MARKKSSKNNVDEGQPSKVVTRPMRRLRGRPLRDFVNKLKQGIQGSEADPDHRQSACAKLDFVVEQIGEWAVDLTDTPSLPNRPRFFPPVQQVA